MKLGNIFSDAQISALKSIANAPTDAETHTSHVSVKTWELLYDLAAELGQRLAPKFWENLDKSIQRESEVAVYLRGKKEVFIEPVIRQVCWARHLGQMFKSGYSVVLIGKATTHVTWDNWKSVYSALTKAADTRKYDVRMSGAEYRSIKTARRKEKEFYDLARPDRTKRSGRCRISFEEANSQRIRLEKLSLECRIENRARKIYEAL